MKKVMLTALAAAAALSLTVEAKPTKISSGFLSEPTQSLVEKLNGSTSMIYSYDMKASSDWDQNTLTQAELFSGFKSFETWDLVNSKDETVIYASEVAFIIDQTVTQENLSKLQTAEFLSEIDPGFNHTSVTKEEANEAYQSAQEEAKSSTKTYLDDITNRGLITSEQKQSLIQSVDTQVQTNLSANWCADGSSQCVKSSARIPLLYQGVLSGASLAGINVPSSVDVYSEVKNLEGQVGVIQTGFLANKTLVSLKNTITAEDLGGRSLIRVKTYVVLEKDDLDKFQFLGSYDFVVGNSSFNSNEGITMGLPLYSQKMAEALKEKL
jgi:hypothetical protein